MGYSQTNRAQGADIVWMMVCSALVLLMVPGISLHYSGTSKKANINMTWMPIITTSIVGLVVGHIISRFNSRTEVFTVVPLGICHRLLPIWLRFLGWIERCSTP